MGSSDNPTTLTSSDEIEELKQEIDRINQNRAALLTENQYLGEVIRQCFNDTMALARKLRDEYSHFVESNLANITAEKKALGDTHVVPNDQSGDQSGNSL